MKGGNKLCNKSGIILPNRVLEEGIMSDLMFIFGWGSTIGTGIFLVCLAGMIYILSRVGKGKEKKE